MTLPIATPVSPMLAKAVAAVPAADSVPGGLSYEPKWDGFRCLVVRDGDRVDLDSRGSKPLTRYFPELVERVLAHLPRRCVVDTEIVVRAGAPGAEHLDWDLLSQRIHPAASRVERLARETPAEIVAFDLLALEDRSFLDESFETRRAALESILATVPGAAGIHLTRVTRDPVEAHRWFEDFEGAGLDGVVAKPLAAAYEPGRRTMLKVKHKRTAEAVVIGYRVHKSGQGVGSLLLGLFTDDGRLVGVGGSRRSRRPAGSSWSRSWPRWSSETRPARSPRPRPTGPGSAPARTCPTSRCGRSAWSRWPSTSWRSTASGTP